MVEIIKELLHVIKDLSRRMHGGKITRRRWRSGYPFLKLPSFDS
jgi:hypothetical protein